MKYKVLFVTLWLCSVFAYVLNFSGFALDFHLSQTCVFDFPRGLLDFCS